MPTEPPKGTQQGLGSGGADGAQHRHQLAGYRRLPDRLGQRPPRIIPARGADREDAGDRVDAGVQAGDVVDETPSPARPAASSSECEPGATIRFEVETAGSERWLPRAAEPVEALPSRLAV